MSGQPRWAYVILTLLVVILASVRSTSPSASTSHEDAPAPEEVRLMEELAAWEGRDSGPSNAEIATMADRVRQQSVSFDLFLEGTHRASSTRQIRALPHGELILEAARAAEVDPFLLASMVRAESSFDPYAESPKGALGLMQMLPTTAALFGVTDPMDPRQNLDAGARYLASLLSLHEGDLVLALAAYNAGPGNVRKYAGVPPFRETRNYLERVLTSYLDSHRSAQIEQASQFPRGGSSTIEAAGR